MRAAVVTELGTPPVLTDRPEPDDPGKAVVELRAAALNPVDLAMAAGRFPIGSPPLPYVPGVEAVGTVVRSSRFPAGERVFAFGKGLGLATDGTFAERFLAPEDALYEVPGEIDDARAVAFGVPGLAAWLPLTWVTTVQAGEGVLVLGATGSLGSVAIQAAKLLGAGRVVGVGRNPERLARARAYGADETVEIGPDLAARIGAAFGDTPPAVVVDGLWGEPVAAALAACAPGARIVQLGQSAGPEATIPSGLVRGKQLRILGFTDFAVPADVLTKGYRELLGHVAAGRISLDVETLPLARLDEAWERQAQGEGVKLVLTP
jgi:NADPH2:quinone reductase